MLGKKIKNREKLLGTWCEIPTPYTVNIIAKAGMDFVIVDMEHGVVDFNLIQNMVYAAQCEGCALFVRVPCIDESYILRVLDTGAQGIIVPQVEKVEDVERIMKYSKYYPDGNRGFNPYIRAGGYTSVGKEFFMEQNEYTVIGIILEGKKALENIKEIVRNPYIDIIYIGQYDLSVALGVPGEVNNKLVIEALQSAIKEINSAGKIAGCMVHDVEEANRLINSGINFIVYKVDTDIIYSGYNLFKKGMK